jgi:hypothetical protein
MPLAPPGDRNAAFTWLFAGEVGQGDVPATSFQQQQQQQRENSLKKILRR